MSSFKLFTPSVCLAAFCLAGAFTALSQEPAKPNSNGAKLLGATVREVPEKARDASALDQVSQDDPPFLIMHGSQDPGVPVEQSTKLHKKLKAAGVSSELHIIECAGHGGPLFNTDEVREKVRRFFERTLKPKPDA